MILAYNAKIYANTLHIRQAFYVLFGLWSTMKYQNNIEPENCSGMEDIRVEIDNMDRFIIAILSKRFEYVKAASKFKTSETSVRAPERFKAMLEQRRVWASSEGLSPDAIEKMYRDLVNYFINEEMSKWQSESIIVLSIRQHEADRNAVFPVVLFWLINGA